MSNDTVERRLFLRGAGLAGATVLASTAMATSASARESDHDDDDVTGAWLITHRDDPGGDTTEVLAVTTFAEGGVFVNQDINPVSHAGVGSWRAWNDNGFKVNFWVGSPGEGPGAHGMTINVKVRGEADDDEISGTYTFTVFDASGKKVADGTGTFEGERIEA